MQKSIEQLNVRQIVKQLVVGSSGTSTPRKQPAEPRSRFPSRPVGMPCIGWRLIAELHRVLEDFQEAFDRISPVMGRTSTTKLSPVMSYPPWTNVPGWAPPRPARSCAGEVPVAGVLAALHFVGPNSTHNAIEHRARPRCLRIHSSRWPLCRCRKRSARSSPFLTVKVTKNGLRAVFDLYDLPPIQVRFGRLGAPSDRAQRAKQMLHASWRHATSLCRW
jgi:hypothetical protein